MASSLAPLATLTPLSQGPASVASVGAPPPLDEQIEKLVDEMLGIVAIEEAFCGYIKRSEANERNKEYGALSSFRRFWASGPVHLDQEQQVKVLRLFVQAANNQRNQRRAAFLFQIFDKIVELGEITASDEETEVEKSLEVLLLARNRTLMNDNTQMKLSITQAKETNEALEKDNKGLQQQSVELKSLVAKLEDDLVNIRAVATMVRSEGEGSACPPLPISSSYSDFDTKIEMEGSESAPEVETTSKALEDAVTASTENLNGTPQPLDSKVSDSLLAIVSSQRERFRQRNQELEAENIGLRNRVGGLQADLDRLRADNIKLYEKIKFLQSAAGRSTLSPSSSRTSVNDEAESRYASHYEQSIDPFQTFAKKERNRKYGNLRPHEKATLTLVRFILGSPLARTFAFFYTVFLHLLVFFVLYRFSLVTESHADTQEECARKFADHMLHIHGKDHV